VSKTRIITNTAYLNANAATYQEMKDWLNGLGPDYLTQPIMLGTPTGEVWALGRPVTIGDGGFMGEAIKVETEDVA
jgi:hypothetical protein